MNLKIKIDVEALAKQCKGFAEEIKRDLQKGVQNLAAVTHAKVAEMASQELGASRQKFMDNLGFEEVSDGVWVVSVSEAALWIEEGIKPDTDMKPWLLKNAKTTASGKRYKVIPFDHTKSPTKMTATAQNIVNQIKSNLRKEGVPFKQIEKNGVGSPKVGKLHSFDWNSDIPGKGNTPSLKGVSIYQTMTKSGNVRRDILTFRTVTDGPESNGKWINPGQAPKKFLDKAMEFAQDTWEKQILPEILNKWK